MNIIKFFECWWNKQHIHATFYDKDGKAMRKCVRCGNVIK